MENIFARMWENLICRVGGPLTFRLILQPMVAACFAVRAGWRDAQQGRGLYGWEIIGDPVNRRELLREGLKIHRQGLCCRDGLRCYLSD